MSLIQFLNQEMPPSNNEWQTLIYTWDSYVRTGNSIAKQQHLLGMLTGNRRHITAATIRKRFYMEFKG